MCAGSLALPHVAGHRRNVSVSSDVSEYHDAASELPCEHGDVDPALGWPADALRRVDWEAQDVMLPSNERSLEERLNAIHSMRKIVLAEPDTGACLWRSAF